MYGQTDVTSSFNVTYINCNKITEVLNLQNQILICIFHRLGPLACSASELTSETMNPFKCFGRTPCTGDWSTVRQHNKEKYGHTSMPSAGFEPMISVFEKFKTICDLDHITTEKYCKRDLSAQDKKWKELKYFLRQCHLLSYILHAMENHPLNISQMRSQQL
jgi:hypothetical protein